MDPCLRLLSLLSLRSQFSKLAPTLSSAPIISRDHVKRSLHGPPDQRKRGPSIEGPLLRSGGLWSLSGLIALSYRPSTSSFRFDVGDHLIYIFPATRVRHGLETDIFCRQLLSHSPA